MDCPVADMEEVRSPEIENPDLMRFLGSITESVLTDRGEQSAGRSHLI